MTRSSTRTQAACLKSVEADSVQHMLRRGKARPVKTDLTAEWVKERLSYDPETGNFTWKIKFKNGRRAGTISTLGYCRIRIGNTSPYAAHRLAWLIVTGRWPEHTIDHINGDPSDNRFCNLREATAAENLRHRGIMKSNKSGVKGVHWFKQYNKWRAIIVARGKQIFLGHFDNIEDAKAAYRQAAVELHGEFARFE